MVKSVISGQEKSGIMSDAIFASSEFHINRTNIELTSHRRALFINGSVPGAYSDAYPLNVKIYNCTFLENVHDMVVNLPDPSQVELAIKNTIFSSRQIISGSFGLLILARPSQILTSIPNAVIELDNVTFDSKPCKVKSRYT